MMAHLSGSSIISWLLCLIVAIGITAAIETFFRESLPRWGIHTGLRIWAYIIEFAFLSSLATAPLLAKAHWSTTVLFHTLPVVAVLVYFIPTAIAIERSSQRLEFIFFVNLLAGWTAVGWLWTLTESLADAHRKQTQIIAERLAPPPPQRRPFITAGMFAHEPQRYIVGQGVEKRAGEAPAAGGPATSQPVRPQSQRRHPGTIFGRPVAGAPVAQAPAQRATAPRPQKSS